MYRIVASLILIHAFAACAGNSDTNEGPEVANAKPEHISGYWLDYSEKSRYDAANSDNQAQACSAFTFRNGNITSVKTYDPLFVDADGNLNSCRNMNGMKAPLDFQCPENKGKVEATTGKTTMNNGCTLKMSANSAAAMVSGLCNGENGSLHLFRASDEGVRRYLQTAIDCYAKVNQNP